MGLAAKLQMRQTQALVMTPQLMQSIRLLQFTHLELERFVDEEIERNPLLERAGSDADVFESAPDIPLPDRVDDSDWFSEKAEPLSAQGMSDRLDSSLENVFPDDPGVGNPIGPDLNAQWKSMNSTGSGASTDFSLEDVTAAQVTLREHVEGQIALTFADALERRIARELADALDETGYLRADLDEIGERFGIEEQCISNVLAACQGLDPVGIFARDLAECLALQLQAKNRLDPAMQALLGRLDLLAKRDFPALKRICGVDEEDLVDMLAEIRALDPRPGLVFGQGSMDSIVPDVIVKAASDGSWIVELNADTLPRVLVDQVYFSQVSGSTRNPAEKEFLNECLQNANWLTRSLDQRAKTILKVSTEIIRQQDAFFVSGVRHLRPLNLRTIAEAIGMHESTVSRVTANKYMMTPRGVFELRYFFTAAIASAEGGDSHSSESVRDRIRELINDERPADVLSDDAIVDILKKNGVDIARRTVAKYREGMSIPSSVQRRREKRAMATAGR